MRALSQHNGKEPVAPAELDEVSLLAVFDVGQRANGDTAGTYCIQIVRNQRHASEIGVGQPTFRQNLDARLGIHDEAAAISAFFRREVDLPLEAQGVFPKLLIRAQSQVEGSGIHWQHRSGDVLARGIGANEIRIAHFVVLRVAAQRIGGRQDDLTAQTVADGRAGNRQLPGRRPGAIAQPLRRHGRALPRQTVDLDAESARQQGIGRRQQGVGTGGQAGNAIPDGDLLPDQRLDGARLAAQWRTNGLVSRYDGIHRVAGQLRQTEPIIVLLHQGMKTRIGRTPSAGDESSPREFAAAGQVQPRPLLHIDLAGIKADSRNQCPSSESAPGTGQLNGDLVDQIVDPIGRASIGHDQLSAADRGQATRQQPYRARGTIQIAAELDEPQRRTHHATLLDIRCHERQTAEYRQRSVRQGLAATFDSQMPFGIEDGLPPLIQSIPGIEGRTRSRHRIELGRSQLQIAVGYQAPRRIAILWIVASETQVALAAQRYLLETWSLIADSLCVDPIDHPVATE